MMPFQLDLPTRFVFTGSRCIEQNVCRISVTVDVIPAGVPAFVPAPRGVGFVTSFCVAVARFVNYRSHTSATNRPGYAAPGRTHVEVIRPVRHAHHGKPRRAPDLRHDLARHQRGSHER